MFRDLSSSKKRIVVAGGGAAGVAAAAAAGKVVAGNAEVWLIESESGLGGDLCSGMPILGSYTARGKRIIGGVLDELTDFCKSNDGYIGPVCDWRAVVGLCLNPLTMQCATSRLTRERRVNVLLGSTITEVVRIHNAVKAVRISCRDGRSATIPCDYVVDATGGGHIVQMAAGEVLQGDAEKRFQPVSLIFRMSGVQYMDLLNFIHREPAEALLAENPALPADPAEAARRLRDAGWPYVALSAKGKLLGTAIGDGRMHPCTAVFITPTNAMRGEVCLNTTRVAGEDFTDPTVLSRLMPALLDQVRLATQFLRKDVPGFAAASVSAIAHRIGVRETGRIVGRRTLTQEEVVGAKMPSDAIALGCHHVDIHGSGVEQLRIPVADGGAYGIPYECLLPHGLDNVAAAGRCISSDRGANGSARVMGTCLATGEAAGTAVALAVRQQPPTLLQIDRSALRYELAANGAVLDA